MTRDEMEALHEVMKDHDSLISWYDSEMERMRKMIETVDVPFICRQCHQAGVAPGYQGQQEWNDGAME